MDKKVDDRTETGDFKGLVRVFQETVLSGLPRPTNVPSEWHKEGM